ncbi:DNA-binding MarR family transcriptional regulator [Nitrobacteraceae bacterium AZCC 2161]|jgi:DNA-binding MarR family transcriptional regulator
MLKPGKLKVLAGAEPPASDYIVDSQVGFLMRVAMQRHTSIFMANMIEDLTQTQFAVMAKLHEVGPSSQNHLGRLVYLDAATIKGVVDRLGLRGFITTGSDPTDRRRRAVSLTDKGTRVMDAAIRVASEISAKTLRPLTAEEQRTLTRLLKKIT